MTSSLFDDPNVIVNRKIGGVTINSWLDADTTCAWYEAKEDAGGQRNLYVYLTAEDREKNLPRIFNFRTRMDETIDIYGQQVNLFIAIGDYRVIIPRQIKKYLAEEQTRPKEISGYEVIDFLGSGFKGVTYKVRKKRGPRTTYALKLTTAEEYAGSSFLPEADRMSDLAGRDRDHFPQIHDYGDYEIEIEGNKHDFVFFVEDFILGNVLEKYLEQQRNSLTAGFAEKFIREMLAALIVLEEFNLMHDDLHAGNIMIRETPAGIRPCLIDFGSAKKKGPTKKERDDIRNLATHIASIANLISLRQAAKSQYEERIMSACESLLAIMSDDDPLRRPDNARELLKRFDDHYPQGTFIQHLTHPFDFGNAEEVMDNQLLHKLAAKSFPWKDKIESSANLLVIGPRGCGKTTVFRSISFKCLADAGHIEEALDRQYIGLYISCNKEFRQRFSALEPSTLQCRHDDIRHYFNLLVLREFCGTMICCEKHNLLTTNDVDIFITFILRQTQISSDISDNHLETLTRAEGEITRSIEHVRMCLWNDIASPNKTRQDFIAELTLLAQTNITPFIGKVIYLLVDDYTERKVPCEAQKALNHILFVPDSVYKSKISSEVFGVPPDQTFGSFLDQDRDYKEWNLGTLYYLMLPTAEQKSFLREIVDKRLELCEFTGRVADIIGDSHYPDGTLARAIKTEAEERFTTRKQREAEEGVLLAEDDREIETTLERKRVKAYYHGWDTICDLCTGDISNILELLNRMYESSGVKRDTVTCIPPERQHAAIQRYSQQYISKIKGIPVYGERLFEIVDAFGTMSGRLLKEYPWLDRGPNRRDPYQMIRIEMDEGFVRSSQAIMAINMKKELATKEISQDAEFLWILLQRYCIFIDAEESRSRRNTLASKVILRRIFCPAFFAGLTNSECFTVDKRQWKAFCADPKGHADRYVRETIEKAKTKRGEMTGGLFSKEQMNDKL